MVMDFLWNAIKTGLLVMGLNGSAQLITVDEAYTNIDDQVEKIQLTFDCNVPDELMEEAKNQILDCSSGGQALASEVDRIARRLEQKVIFGFENETIGLPIILKKLGRIYHLKANNQLKFRGPGTSCGYWSAANAGSITKYLAGHNGLNLREINASSIDIIPQMFRAHEPNRMLIPRDVSWLAHLDFCKLNCINFQGLRNVLTQGLINGKKIEILQNICLNKLHIINIAAGDVSPCCFSADFNGDVTDREAALAIIQRFQKNKDSYIKVLINELVEICSSEEILNAEILSAELSADDYMDWDYLGELTPGLNEIMRAQILSFIIQRKSQLIDQQRLGVIEEIADTTYMQALTLANLGILVQCNKDDKTLDELGKLGLRSRLEYFKTLADYWSIKNEDENNALHFACHVGYHWILISVIHLPDIGPVLVVLDSMNDEINSNWQDNELDESIEKLGFWVAENEDDLDNSSKLSYILFLYNLFVRGDLSQINRALHKLSKLTRNGVNGFHDRDRVVDIHRDPTNDPTPGSKGKERERYTEDNVSVTDIRLTDNTDNYSEKSNGSRSFNGEGKRNGYNSESNGYHSNSHRNRDEDEHDGCEKQYE